MVTMGDSTSQTGDWNTNRFMGVFYGDTVEMQLMQSTGCCVSSHGIFYPEMIIVDCWLRVVPFLFTSIDFLCAIPPTSRSGHTSMDLQPALGQMGTIDRMNMVIQQTWNRDGLVSYTYSGIPALRTNTGTNDYQTGAENDTNGQYDVRT